MYCLRCKSPIPNNVHYCGQCGAPVVLTSQPGYGYNPLIPRNAMALWSYYLGFISLLFFPLAIVSLICGISGIRFANANPLARGKVHAWVGIIFSLLTLIITIAVIITFALFGN